MNEYILWGILFVLPLLLWRPYKVSKTLILFGFALMTYPSPRDDTDTAEARSGMAVYKDAKTGCQYLRAGYFSSLTPRLDENGRPMCSRSR